MDNRMRLLMTETSPELCRLCREILPAQSIELTVCPRNGAVAYSEMVRHKPDAALLDVFMPGMDAITLKRSIARRAPTPLPFFMLPAPSKARKLRKR